MKRQRLKLLPRGPAFPERLEPPAARGGELPVHDLRAERATISACTLSHEALDCVLGWLKPEHFHDEKNGRIFMALCALRASGHPIDMISVLGWLRDREWLAAVGGPAYLAETLDVSPVAADMARHATAHAKKVFDLWRVRQASARAQRLNAESYHDVGDVQQWLEEQAASFAELTHQADQRELVSVADLAKSMWDEIKASAERGDTITGTPTGYEKLDGKTAGLHDGDLIIVAARPGMGKTSFVLNVAVNVASPRADGQEPDAGVCVFSLEMPRGQLMRRAACTEGRVDLGRLRQNLLLPDDWRRLTEASTYLAKLPIWVDDTPAIGLAELRAKVKRKQAEFNRNTTAVNPGRRVGLVIIDYLQLMREREFVTSREQEISAISRGLKELAKELGVPVIALSSLNRSVENRSVKDKRPGLADLRESGAIEADADTIIFIYRDEYYNPETTNARGIAELIIAKQRNGPTGKVLVRFAASYTRFDNLAAGEYPEMDDCE